MAADPTYPLLPIFSIPTAVLLLLVLTTNFVRQSWNLGIFFLCFWLFWEILTLGINAILWSDSAEAKFYVYCDIVSRLQIFTSIVKPACMLLISRQLYRIASLRSVVLLVRACLIRQVIFPDYIVQAARFSVQEGAGCTSAIAPCWLAKITLYSWPIVLPSIAVFFYCRMCIIFYVFYRHSREINNFLLSNDSISRPCYLRLLALVSVGIVLDIVLMLPYGTASTAGPVLGGARIGSSIPFYNGWELVHSHWKPVTFSYRELQTDGSWILGRYHLSHWSPVVFGLTTFVLFGLTADARATYRRGLYAIGRLFGFKPTMHQRASVDEIIFANGLGQGVERRRYAPASGFLILSTTYC
ncbi:GPCR fungal pheromone mating factor [Vararia minispora EC-137]|uniref:GPCR fungal pheromone mating factor n=1 Tax=Vararia minispora EC-137 TaxID=1314806 RepID=A0ACB8QJP7_9AGAM|nr:GPCR fungal pheromone mating factor [Vararia minispora EC-137]